MYKSFKRVLLFLVLANRLSAHLVTSVITVFQMSPSTTPCTELSPISNRMQWVQQCAMALSNIGPPDLSTPARISCFGRKCSTLRTPSTKGLLTTRSSRNKHEPQTTDNKSRGLRSTTIIATGDSAPTESSDGHAIADQDTSSSHKVGVIAGAVCCVLVVIALLVWILWRTRNKWLGYFKRPNEKFPEAREQYWWNNRSFQRSEKDPTPKFWGRSQQDLDGSPTAPRGYSHGCSYIVTNPDPPSVRTVTEKSRTDSILSLPYVECSDVEDPAMRPDSNVHSSKSGNEDGDIAESEVIDGYSAPITAPPTTSNRQRSSNLIPEEDMSGGLRTFDPNGE